MSEIAFVLPPELELDLEGDVLRIRHPGDVVLHQDLGRQLDVEAAGDLEVRLPSASGKLRCGGVLRVSDQVDGGDLHGREVHVEGADIRCRAISATEKIVIGRAKLQVDVILAPHIEIDAGATGRVTVIQSENERGPTKIKGGFTLQEYEEVFGDADRFLRERGVAPMGEAPRESLPIQPRARDAAEEEETEPAPRRGKKPRKLAPAPPPEPEDLELEDEDLDDPLSLSDEDLVPIQTDHGDDELYPLLRDAVDRIVTCYRDKEVPPPVSRLKEMVESRDYPALREDITDVWNGLLGYHQQHGIRPHHQVTHAFNVIHGLLQPG